MVIPRIIKQYLFLVEYFVLGFMYLNSQTD